MKRANGSSNESRFHRWEDWKKSFRSHPSIPDLLSELEERGVDLHHLLSTLHLVPEVMDRVEDRHEIKKRVASLAKAKRLANNALSVLSEVEGEGKKLAETRLWLSLARKQLSEQILAAKKHASARSWDSTDYAICSVCAYLRRFLPRGVYRVAAALLDAARISGDFPTGGCWDEDSVKKRDSRFRKNYPGIAQYIEKEERAVTPPQPPQLDTFQPWTSTFGAALIRAFAGPSGSGRP